MPIVTATASVSIDKLSPRKTSVNHATMLPARIGAAADVSRSPMISDQAGMCQNPKSANSAAIHDVKDLSLIKKALSSGHAMSLTYRAMSGIIKISDSFVSPSIPSAKKKNRR
jgi:hypothetical protein